MIEVDFHPLHVAIAHLHLRLRVGSSYTYKAELGRSATSVIFFRIAWEHNGQTRAEVERRTHKNKKTNSFSPSKLSEETAHIYPGELSTSIVLP